MQQTLSAGALGDAVGDLAREASKRGGQAVEALQGEGLLVDGVPAEEFVGALAREHHLDVLASGLGHEVQRDECGVGDRIVEVPDDLRDRGDVLLGGDGPHDVPGPDGGRRLRCDVGLRIAFALERCGEGDQIGVVLDRERRDGRRIDTAGQERSDGDVGAHVLGDGVGEDVGDLVVALLTCGVGEGPDRELRAEVGGDRWRAAGTHGCVRTGLEPTDR